MCPESSTRKRSSPTFSILPDCDSATDSRVAASLRMNTLRPPAAAPLAAFSTKKTRRPSPDDWNCPGDARSTSARCSKRWRRSLYWL